MSVFEKSQEIITEKMIEELKKENKFLLKKTYTTELGTHHEFLIKPLSYIDYVKSVEKLYTEDSENNLYEKYDISLQLLLPQLVYPVVTIEDFKIEDNPSGFLFNILNDFQNSFSAVPNESFLYYDDYKKVTNDARRAKFMSKLEEISKEHMFSLGVIYEDNLSNRYYFIFNKLKNSQIEKIRRLYIDKKEQIFEQIFGSYAPEIKMKIYSCIDKKDILIQSEAAEQLLHLFTQEDHKNTYIKKISMYNDFITLKLLNMHDEDIAKIFSENILYSEPFEINEVHAQIVTALYNEMQSPIRINRIIPLIEGKELVNEFCDKYKVPIHELELFMQKLSDQN